MYAGVSLVSVIFVIFCVPETRNLSTGEIEAIFEPDETAETGLTFFRVPETEEYETSN